MKKKVVRWKLKKLLLDSGKIPQNQISGIINQLIKHYNIISPIEKIAEVIIKGFEVEKNADKSGG